MNTMDVTDGRALSRTLTARGAHAQADTVDALVSAVERAALDSRDALALEIVESALRHAGWAFERPGARVSEIAATAEGALTAAMAIAEGAELRGELFALRVAAASAAATARVTEETDLWRDGYAWALKRPSVAAQAPQVAA